MFILTHYPREPVEMEGGTTFHFVTDGIESALEQARKAPAAKTSCSGVAPTSRTSSWQRDCAQARERLREAVGQLERRLPKIAAMHEEAEDDVLAFYAFPAEHWSKLRTTNPLERSNREIGRRTDVVGIFPDDPSLIRLVSMLAIEANDEWLVGRSYVSQKSMATLWERGAGPDIPIDKEKEVELIAA